MNTALKQMRIGTYYHVDICCRWYNQPSRWRVSVGLHYLYDGESGTDVPINRIIRVCLNSKN